MRHRVKVKKLKRVKASREALIENLARSLILENNVKTTLAKAKTVRSFAEKLITIGKRKDLAAKRLLLSKLSDEKAVNLLLTKFAEQFADREGGYTSITKIGFRQGDGAKLARLSIISVKK